MLSNKNRGFLTLETLEDRLTPSFSAFYNPTGDIWTLTQVQDDGDATIAITGSQLVVSDGAGTATFGTALGTLNVKMLNNSTGDVTVTLDSALVGNLSVALGNGARDLNIRGTDKSIGGNLSITGGSGNQTVDLIDAGTSLNVGGSANIDLGLGDDSVGAAAFGPVVRVGGDLTMRGVNSSDPTASLIIGRAFNFYVNNETDPSPPTNLTLDNTDVIGTSLTFLGNNATDLVRLQGTTVGTNVYINLANGLIGGPPSTVLIGTGAATTTIGGNLTVLGGTGQESIDVGPNAVIGGSIYVNAGTMGTGAGGVGSGDTVSLQGTIGGGSVQVLTGLDLDSVTYSMTGSNPRVTVMLGLGNDTFTLGAGADLSYLYVDFGAGSDSFANNFGGAFTFPAALRNLP